MRILLTANASYAPPRGGATRSNLLWLDHLARAGHQCRVVCGPAGEGAALAADPRIQIHAIAEPGRRIQTLREQIGEWKPDWVLVSSEDLGHALLREAHHSAAGRIVYLAHTPQFFPFGPASWNPEESAARIVAESAGIVAIGHHMAGYIERALGRSAAVIHPPIYGAGPFPHYQNFAHGRVVMINPCAVKGAGIFIETAAQMPSWEFGAVPGWGTTADDRRAIERFPNARLLPNAPSIDDILAETRVLMMPSLWYEGFGLIVMEAMLRGIPVVASDSGGLKEAKAGTGYVIPVETIESYQPAFDEHTMPKPVLPAVEAAPWVESLTVLLTDPVEYERESEASRAAALRLAGALDASQFEHFLLTLQPGVERKVRTRATVESLSPERRTLLLEKLRRRGMAE